MPKTHYTRWDGMKSQLVLGFWQIVTWDYWTEIKSVLNSQLQLYTVNNWLKQKPSKNGCTVELQKQFLTVLTEDMQIYWKFQHVLSQYEYLGNVSLCLRSITRVTGTDGLVWIVRFHVLSEERLLTNPDRVLWVTAVHSKLSHTLCCWGRQWESIQVKWDSPSVI